MKKVLLFLFVLNIAYAQDYLRDLEEQGYCVIPNVISDEETEILYERVWHEYIEKAWPNCKMDDRSNWKEAFPIHNKVGIFAGPAGQIQPMWDIRQDARIIEPFTKIWNTNELIVSMDGLSIMCPVEIRKGTIEPWPHVDQASTLIAPDDSSLSTKPYTIQGQFLFEDSFDGDGGFYCLPKSHLRFKEFAPAVEAIMASYTDITKARAGRNAFLTEFTADYEKKHITAPRGSLILWDSRTIHWNQHASPDRPKREQPRVRMVGYVCYVPKARLKDATVRQQAWLQGISTTHDPANPLPRPSKDGQLFSGYEQYLEDASYIQPKISLSPLGESLLGFSIDDLHDT